MLTLQDVLKEKMKDPVFKKEWDALEPEFQAIRADIEARQKSQLEGSPVDA